MNGNRRLVFSRPSRSDRIDGVKRCLPLVVLSCVLIIMSRIVAGLEHGWLLYLNAAILSLPALPHAGSLLKTLWTRREVTIDLSEKTITESFRLPWRNFSRWCTFDSVLHVRIVLDAHRRELILALALEGGKELLLDRLPGSVEAVSLANVISRNLGVEIQGRIAPIDAGSWNV